MASWQIVNNELVPIDCSEPPKWGAFVNSSVTVITIPISVKEIGEFAFHNTKLKEVCISRYCGRYDTSFPEDCKISYYEGEAGDFMLYDSSDYLLLDNTGAMILVRGD